MPVRQSFTRRRNSPPNRAVGGVLISHRRRTRPAHFAMYGIKFCKLTQQPNDEYSFDETLYFTYNLIMITTLKVEKGTITLPPRLRRLWQNVEINIRDYGDKIALEGPPTKPKVDIAAWKKMSGILKNRRIPDPVVWQRKIRKGWERKLPRPSRAHH